jgi:hypothetical protein
MFLSDSESDHIYHSAANICFGLWLSNITWDVHKNLLSVIFIFWPKCINSFAIGSNSCYLQLALMGQLIFYSQWVWPYTLLSCEYLLWSVTVGYHMICYNTKFLVICLMYLIKHLLLWVNSWLVRYWVRSYIPLSCEYLLWSMTRGHLMICI